MRVNSGESIESLVYGRVVAENIDPIEKKPLFHVLPASLSYSIATPGCNFTCLHCQNSSISQVPAKIDFDTVGVYRKPEQIVFEALAGACKSISYTYVEPAVFYEFAYDCCLAAEEAGLKNIFVSNGYMSSQTRENLAPVLTAINIDLKSFSEQFYKKVCGASLQPVLDNIYQLKEQDVWVEVTTLLIPGMNDSDEELQEIAAFLMGVDSNIPWHVTAFYPSHKMTTAPPTPASTLARARQIGIDCGLHHVYTGNIPGSGGENSYCSSCNTELIRRMGFRVVKNVLAEGKCPNCSTPLAGIWS